MVKFTLNFEYSQLQSILMLSEVSFEVSMLFSGSSPLSDS